MCEYSVSKVQITCVSKCHPTSNFQYHKYIEYVLSSLGQRLFLFQLFPEINSQQVG